MNNVHFDTTDICLAAYLFVKKFKIKEIKKLGNKGTFVFDGVPPEAVVEFDTGTSSVEPQAFHQAIRQLTTAVRRQ